MSALPGDSAGRNYELLPLGVINQSPLTQGFLLREGIRDLALAICTEDRFRFISACDAPRVGRFVLEHFSLTVRMLEDFKGRTFTTCRCTPASAGPQTAAVQP